MNDLRFIIDAFRPDTIPMARLAEYMAALADLLGHEKSVHFVRLDPGSVELVHQIDAEDRPKVDARLDGLRRGDGPADANKAFRRLDDMLAQDDASGALADDAVGIVIPFLGRDRPKPIDYGTFSQAGSFDGIPVKVGGLAEMVPIHIQETGPTRLVHNCFASRGMARAIAPHLFETSIRVHGNGRWCRTPSGAWTLQRFVINDFEVLDNSPLTAVVARLRAIEGNGWREVDRPLETLRTLRNDEGHIH